MLKQKILDEEIKLFRVDNLYRIYGKTFDVKDELEKAGAKWNSENKKLEISLDNFEKLSDDIKRFFIFIFKKLNTYTKKMQM